MSFIGCYISSAYISHDSSFIARVHGNVGVLFFLILDKNFGEHSRVGIGKYNQNYNRGHV